MLPGGDVLWIIHTFSQTHWSLPTQSCRRWLSARMAPRSTRVRRLTLRACANEYPTQATLNRDRWLAPITARWRQPTVWVTDGRVVGWAGLGATAGVVRLGG